ncbi:MAG: hypothetical protein HOH43_06965 [Candidatus Latescibacteria bacterium]|jgi:hypothetical protein|nr:hypothetical protein [Candidatus Latescibacterota bacterium]
MNPSLRLILFCHARSGSTSLCRMLNLHPQLNILEEPLSEDFTKWHPEERDYAELINDIDSLNEQMDHIFSRYNGIKVLHFELRPPRFIYLLGLPAYTVIFLRRRNLLQTVVSSELAEQSTKWTIGDLERPIAETYADLKPLSIEQVQGQMEALQRELELFDAVISHRPAGTYLKLWYEDLYMVPADKRLATVGSICRFLELAPIDDEQIHAYLDPSEAKMNNASTYRLIPNAHEIDQQLGSDATGWLFDQNAN